MELELLLSVKEQREEEAVVVFSKISCDRTLSKEDRRPRFGLPFLLE